MPPFTLFLLAGPTAVGKSAVALLLAERLGGEIISVDSMQVYRGMDIGTAKPTAGERNRVPHHLIDILDVTERFDSAQFAQCAQKALEDIQAPSRVAILCGGTGLYFKAFLEGLGDSPAADPALRAALEAAPMPELLQELQTKDPVTFHKIDQKNPRRIIRALEVIRLTGKPYSAQRAPWKRNEEESSIPATFFYLERDPADLHARIDARVNEMFERGLVKETEHLLAKGLEQNQTAMQAIGYRQVIEHLRGQRSLPETVELVKLRTRQFAKRQKTWFRHQAPLRWLTLDPQETPDHIAQRLINAAASAPIV